MPVETPADLAGFFNPDEFGAAAIHTRGGVDTVVNGIFDDPFQAALQEGDGFAIGDRAPSFTCAVAALPADAGEGDALSVNGTAWTIAGPVELDGTGLAVLRLARSG